MFFIRTTSTQAPRQKKPRSTATGASKVTRPRKPCPICGKDFVSDDAIERCIARHAKAAPQLQWTAYELVSCPIEDEYKNRCGEQFIGCGTLKYHVDQNHDRHQPVSCPHERCIKKASFKSLGDYFRHYKQALGHRTLPADDVPQRYERYVQEATDEERQHETANHEEGQDEAKTDEEEQGEAVHDETQVHEEEEQGEAVHDETQVHEDENADECDEEDEAMDTTVQASAPTYRHMCLYCQEPMTALTIGAHLSTVHDYVHSTDDVKCSCCDARYSITRAYLHHSNFTSKEDPHYMFKIRCEWCEKYMPFGNFVRHEETCDYRPTSVTVADIKFCRATGRFPEADAAFNLPKTFAPPPMVALRLSFPKPLHHHRW